MLIFKNANNTFGPRACVCVCTCSHIEKQQEAAAAPVGVYLESDFMSAGVFFVLF